MNKQELSALNMAGFIKSQTLILFKLNQLNLYDCADECEDLHDMAENNKQKIVATHKDVAAKARLSTNVSQTLCIKNWFFGAPPRMLAKGRPVMPVKPMRDVQSWQYTGNLYHPTQKPISSLQPLIESFTQPNDIVLDPFAGSGFTCVASALSGRHYIGIKLLAEYHARRLFEFERKYLYNADELTELLAAQLIKPIKNQMQEIYQPVIALMLFLNQN
ncbi:Methyltransferase [Aphis craccivora]|uniref:Methyltransferase n=1 Tax=Aphis craccivora TaxID=307492 RepID=A0A6G0XSR0_APHCR|nr:Methyltransferase [Aphis craccivora]